MPDDAPNTESEESQSNESKEAPSASPDKRSRSDVFSKMYAQWTMDGAIVEIALAVSRDFVERPSYFTCVPTDTADILANLWYRTGSDPHFPDRQKRALIYGAIFGQCDCGKTDDRPSSAQFHLARDAVLEAAVRYTKRTFDDGRQSLFLAFRDRLITLREYLTTFEGVGVEATYTQTSGIFADCTRVLKAREIAGAYGLPPAPDEAAWPIGGEYSGKGAHLIEAISEKTRPPLTGVISRQQVLASQRVAFDGCRTIESAFNADLKSAEYKSLEPVIETAFTWWTALQDGKGLPEIEPPSDGRVAPDAEGESLTAARSGLRPVRP